MVLGLSESQASEPFDDRIRREFPEHLREVHFLLPTYKWLFLLGVVFAGIAADVTVRLTLRQITRWFIRGRSEADSSDKGRNFWRPLGLLSQAVIWYSGVSLIDLPTLTTTILLVGLKIFTVVAGVWTGFLFINLMANYMVCRASRTPSKFDDVLVPLVAKSLKVFVLIVGLLTCAQAFSLPMRSSKKATP